MALGMPGFSSQDRTAGLYANSSYHPPQATYAHGAHFVEVEVNPHTAAVTIQNYIVVHDCGVVVNPMVVDGQVQGGLAHGIGNAFLEECLYDDNGQPTTTTYMDYLMPEAVDVPEAQVVHLQSPTPLNPLGVKGAGEGGTIPAAAALIAAVEDALHAWRPRITHHPLKPEHIHAILAQPQQTTT
jgi:carbon-monoxide dehydrogenase large subunit